VAAPARQAADGQVIHITEGGQRIAAIVPESMVEALQAAEDDAEADAAWDEPGEPIPLEQIEAEFRR
jgi:antitoxin (DNA-binding transcriptional repressor) of toxin-antitoxin stability system